MHVNAALVLSALGLLPTTAWANPTPNLVVIDTKETAEGTLTYYGQSSPPPSVLSPEPAVAKRDCGAPQISCSSNHQADVGSCRALITSLVINKFTGLSVEPRSICLTQNGSQCCVSWGTDVSGLTEGQLVPIAELTIKTCNAGNNAGSVSGLSRKTMLNDVCTTQCLSNRPDSCS